MTPNRRATLGERFPRAPEASGRALSAEQQWDKVADVVSTEIGRARSAAQLQSAAAEQLDAASYTFSRIMAEISGTMQETRSDVSKLIEQSAVSERELQEPAPEAELPAAAKPPAEADARIAA